MPRGPKKNNIGARKIRWLASPTPGVKKNNLRQDWGRKNNPAEKVRLLLAIPDQVLPASLASSHAFRAHGFRSYKENQGVPQRAGGRAPSVELAFPLGGNLQQAGNMPSGAPSLRNVRTRAWSDCRRER